MLVTCVYVVSSATPWVEQSLFLAAIGEARDKGAKALEAFAYRYPEGESTYERFLVHRTVFPRDFLADFGFRSVRAQGRVELLALELGGLVPVVEGKRAAVLRVVKEAFAPAPVPQRPVTASLSRPRRRLADVSRSSCGNNRHRLAHASGPTLAVRRGCLAAAILLAGATPMPSGAPERVHGRARCERREPDGPCLHAGRTAARDDPVRCAQGCSGRHAPVADPALDLAIACSARPTRKACSALAVDPAFAANGFVYALLHALQGRRPASTGSRASR